MTKAAVSFNVLVHSHHSHSADFIASCPQADGGKKTIVKAWSSLDLSLDF